MKTIKTLFISALFALGLLAQPPFEQLRADAIKQSAVFALQINTFRAGVYERALFDAARNLHEKGVPARVDPPAAKIVFDVDNTTLVITQRTLSEPVSTKTIADYLDIPEGPGYPVGNANGLGGFQALDNCWLGEVAIVGGGKYICGTYNNSPFSRAYFKLQ